LTEHAPTFAVVNYDDPRGRKWIDDFDESVELLSFGLDPAAELSARIVTMDRQGMSLRFSGPWGEANILTDLRGEAEARNLLSVAGALVLLGMDWSEACRQLEYVRPVPVDCSLRGTVIESDRALEQAA
jgi:UDP-N-acetylmuramyl tripeptide synthase